MEKVVFKFFNEIIEMDDVESVSAEVVDKEKGYYRLKSIPLFVTGYSLEDIVIAKLAKNGLVVEELSQASGNSTLTVIFLDNDIKKETLAELKKLGAAYEGVKDIDGYYSVNVPKEVNYKPIFKLLEKHEEEESLSFRESCIEHK